MKISTTHQRFVRILSNQRALEHPEEFLGPNWKDILNFWLYLDTLSSRIISSVDQQTVGLSEPYSIIGVVAAYSAYPASLSIPAGNATLELICCHKILERGESLRFVSLLME
jgi:hypothetical protein